ncbi:hypothetical protein HPP92_000778 [Vanilla planifolia]|uniref:sphingosine kinase n=1 Tax=Vanilla planifolia TaxID=51239 RepID=A0A835RYN9_VANPL|nr:hypothetical protein HPP92_000778 [Vanilla planifolia]
MERIQVNGQRAEASLSAGGELLWRIDGGVEQRLVIDSQVLGFAAEGKEIKIRSFVGDLEGPSCGRGDLERSVMKEFVLEMPTEMVAEIWSQRLQGCIDSLGRPKRLFIILNPYGGKRSARKIFNIVVKPLLLAANIIYTLQETEYQLHSQELAYKLDILMYDGIACISGDGVLVEVVNGLLQREDWETAIKVPLGIIPAGTGNGLAKSLMESVGEMYSIQNASFAVIRGHKRSLDVTSVLQGEKRFFSILMLTWGLLADVDIESERYRWMGRARLDFYCFLRIMNLRKYYGNVKFVPAPGYEFHGEPKKEGTCCLGSIDNSEQGGDAVTEDSQKSYQGPTASFKDSDWRSFDGPFISISLVNVPWVVEDVMQAPEAKFSDGFLDLVLIKDCPKSALLSILMKTKNGTHVQSPYVIYLKVKAVKLVPGNRVGHPKKGGIVDVDGEVIARGEGTYVRNGGDLMAYGPPIQLTVDQGLATVFSLPGE